MDGRVSAGTYLRRCWWWCDKAVEVGREKKRNNFGIIVVRLCGVAWERYYGLMV